MTSNYTRRIERAHVAEINTACHAIRGMLEGFIKEEHADTIRLLNSVRPIDVIEYILGRELTTEEGTAYLSAIEDIPVDLQHAYKAGKVWQDLKQASRKYLQGKSMDSKTVMVKRFKQFLQGMETSRIRVK